MRSNSMVRGVLAAYGIDQNILYVTSRSGQVCLRGKLKPGMGAIPLKSSTLVAIQDEIMKQKGIKKVTWQLDNWKMIGTNWVNEE